MNVIKSLFSVFVAFLPFVSAACTAPKAKITAGWETYEIPREIVGYAREKHVIEEMERRATNSLKGKGDLIPSVRESERMGDLNGNYALLASALTEDRAVYVHFALPYPNITGLIESQIQFCKVDIPLAALPKEQSHDEAMPVADDISRNGNCNADAPRSEEYRRLKAQRK